MGLRDCENSGCERAALKMGRVKSGGNPGMVNSAIKNKGLSLPGGAWSGMGGWEKVNRVSSIQKGGLRNAGD